MDLVSSYDHEVHIFLVQASAENFVSGLCFNISCVPVVYFYALHIDKPDPYRFEYYSCWEHFTLQHRKKSLKAWQILKQKTNLIPLTWAWTKYCFCSVSQ